MNTDETVAFLGTGLLGKPLAKRLLEAGVALRVWNRTQSKALSLQESGATLCDTPRSAAHGASVVFVCVRDEAAVVEVLEGPEGALAGASHEALIADVSTIGPSAAMRIRESLSKRGFRYLQVPVIGSGSAAEAGELVVLEGGPREDLVKVEAIMRPAARRFIFCGDVADAAKAKLAVNTLLGLLNQAIAEGFTLGEALGLPTNLVLDVLSETPAGRQVERKRKLIVTGEFEPSFKLELLLKDVRLALEEAHAVYPVPRLPALQAVEEVLAEAVAASWKDLDYSAMAGYLSGRASSLTE